MKGVFPMKLDREEEREARENRMTRIVMALGIAAVWAFLLSQNAGG
jgi:hypothetical protein